MGVETEETSKAMAPKFVQGPTDQAVQEGKMVRFDCRATGRPYPEVRLIIKRHQTNFQKCCWRLLIINIKQQISEHLFIFVDQVTWLLNGLVVSSDARHKILVNEMGNHSLMITEASVQDTGVLQCVARNKTGEAACQVRGHVCS